MQQNFPQYVKPEWYDLLLASPFIEKITPHQVIYTGAFKSKYSKLHQQGLSHSEIMIECGFPVEYGQTKAMQAFRKRYKNYLHSNNSLEDMETALAIEEMKKKIQRLEQENEFLKKKFFIIENGRLP